MAVPLSMASFKLFDAESFESRTERAPREGRPRRLESAGDAVDLRDEFRFERHLHGLHAPPNLNVDSYSYLRSILTD